MSSNSCDFTAIRQAILQGQLDRAESMLSGVSAVSPSEMRMQAHFSGIIDYQRGKYSVALHRMRTAEVEFGPNVSLLRDMTACLYHMGDMAGFRSHLERLELALLEHEAKLETRTLLECELMLGKFHEEEARLKPAALFYERALSHTLKPEHRWRGLIQKARWQALYDPGDELSLLYRELISIPLTKITHDLQMELEHSLMLIELKLIGADHAWSRIERVLKEANDTDQRLFVFDFAEGALAQGLALRSSVMENMRQFKGLDPYEQFIWQLVQGALEGELLNAKLINELWDLAPQVSWACYVRLLCLSANLANQTAVKEELYRKIHLIVRGLDSHSQALWNARLKEALTMDEIKVSFSSRRRSLTVHGKNVDLSKKKIALQLLSGLSAKRSLSVEAAIQLLWQCDFSPEHYHRLRMSTHRLNSLVHQVTGLGKIIEVDSQVVKLRPEVQLQGMDNPASGDLLEF